MTTYKQRAARRQALNRTATVVKLDTPARADPRADKATAPKRRVPARIAPGAIIFLLVLLGLFLGLWLFL